jgi:hypothetical protein
MAGTKRTPIYRPPQRRITQRAVDLFRLAVKMEDDGVPADSREYSDVALALHRELGLKVWDEFVTNVNVNDVPRPNIDPTRRASLERAVELRGQLMSCCT